MVELSRTDSVMSHRQRRDDNLSILLLSWRGLFTWHYFKVAHPLYKAKLNILFILSNLYGLVETLYPRIC